MKLTPKDRKKRVLEILEESGSVEVSDLSAQFDVSEMSIRNDLNSLGRQGKLVRRHGGAEIAQTQRERPRTEKQNQNYQKKYSICRKAALMLSNGMSVMLDAGTTTEHIVNFLDNLSQLTIITNGVNLINGLIERPAIQTYTVGGRIDPRSFSILGESAENGLKKYSAQIGFITADGVSLDFGITNNSQEATNISRILIKNSKRKVLLVDSSKVGKIGVFPLCPWDEIDTWITDSEIDPDCKKAVESMGIEVLISD